MPTFKINCRICGKELHYSEDPKETNLPDMDLCVPCGGKSHQSPHDFSLIVAKTSCWECGFCVNEYVQGKLFQYCDNEDMELRPMDERELSLINYCFEYKISNKN